MPGMTGYFGLMDVGQPKPGETVVVSGAAGAVGQTVGQLAKIKGCRVVGIAGGAATSATGWSKELGFDACIDYKAGPAAVREGLKAHCPKGVDIYFDNVGGEILDAVLARLARGARIIICGAISQYNNTNSARAGPEELPEPAGEPRAHGRHRGLRLRRPLPPRRGRAGRLPEGRPHEEPEDVVEGASTPSPRRCCACSRGENFGKLVLKVSD